MKQYNHKEIEKKWQEQWEKDGLYKTEGKSSKKKYYALVEFPYPSGDGLHAGHPRPYIGLDIVARKRRAEGFNVLYPFGWDAFGLPTENYAIKTGVHPKEVTKKNTDNFRRQVKSLGISFDWSREINTTEPEYYKWTQWIFLKLFEHGLAYKAKVPINWCLSCKIGLANEEVVDGACERCGGETEKRDKEQWMLAITKYADRLDKDLDTVDYPSRVKVEQRNWIGRREGALVEFKTQNSKFVEVFTTRPDTLFGATYLVLSPEHEEILKHKSQITNWDEVEKYTKEAKKKKEIERTAEGKEKTGVELKGVKAINPATKEEVPIWVADYVFGGYGTGAIMAVPAHDQRDFEFAKKFKLPVRPVIVPCFVQTTEPGKVVEGKPFVERDAIFAIVKHWEKDLYIGLKWKKVAWQTLITGGIEKGDTAEVAAIKEIIEETGYTHPKLVKDLGLVHSKFYHPPKGDNRFGHFRMFYFELADGTRNELSDEEKEIHDVLWLSKNEMDKFLTPASHLYAWKLLTEKEHSYEGGGILTNSGRFDGLSSNEAGKAITEFVGGKKQTTYKLRDWVFSRQRYWGEPIPIVHCEKDGWVPVPEGQLPVRLPDVENYKPADSGESPLANITEWVNVKCPKCAEPARRETDVMPNWAGSSWYYLAYIMRGVSPSFEGPISKYKDAFKTWLPVDWYNGGMEHTTLHLLYSRFWHKFLYDIKVVPTGEPYQKRTSHGLVLAEGGEKMSKSKGNVINPDHIVERLGADTFRLYEMFMGPFDQAIAWNTDSIAGVRRFIERVWRLRTRVDKQTIGDQQIERLLHKTIKKVGEDVEVLKFNTAISQLMILAHAMEKLDKIPAPCYNKFLQMMALFTPHVAEDLWHDINGDVSVHRISWPAFDEKKIAGDAAIIAVQINGKIRDSFEVYVDENEHSVLAKALEREDVKKWTDGKEPQKTIYIKGKLLSIVIK